MLVSCSQACGCTPPLSDTFAASAFPYPICPLSCLEENGGFRSRDFLRLLRLASFRDCKFLDVGLKGAKTFAAKYALAASSGFLSAMYYVLLERKHFRKSSFSHRTADRLIHELSTTHSLRRYRISRSRFPPLRY